MKTFEHVVANAWLKSILNTCGAHAEHASINLGWHVCVKQEVGAHPAWPPRVGNTRAVSLGARAERRPCVARHTPASLPAFAGVPAAMGH